MFFAMGHTFQSFNYIPFSHSWTFGLTIELWIYQKLPSHFIAQARDAVVSVFLLRIHLGFIPKDYFYPFVYSAEMYLIIHQDVDVQMWLSMIPQVSYVNTGTFSLNTDAF